MSAEFDKIKLWWFNIPLATRVILAVLSLLYFFFTWKPFDYCLGGQSILSSSLSNLLSTFWASPHLHGSLLHLLFNLLSLVSVAGAVEVRMGSGGFACLWLSTVVLSNVLFLIIEALLQVKGAPWYGHVHPTCVIGASGVIFGLMMYDAVSEQYGGSGGSSSDGGSEVDGGPLMLWGVVSVRARWMPVVAVLFVTWLLFPQSSFVMHLSGMVSGAMLWAFVPVTAWQHASAVSSRWLGRLRHHEEGLVSAMDSARAKLWTHMGGEGSSFFPSSSTAAASAAHNNAPFSGVGRRLGSSSDSGSAPTAAT